VISFAAHCIGHILLELIPPDAGTWAETVRDEIQTVIELGLVATAPLMRRTIPLGCVDAEKLPQVLANLVENARDALLEVPRERRLEIGLERSNGGARLVVADNGPGFGDGALPRVFEPFFSQKAHGTGLGLAIVRRTIEAHGGTISAEPAAAGGASFAIDLPLRGEA
jgi:C4-dicarboxylate-specific signal transduction histidine kinase